MMDDGKQITDNRKPLITDTLGTEKEPMSLIDTDSNRQWVGLDSNQRRLTPMGLQPIPFSHSGTDPTILN
jgi:hypothetical protein